MGIVATLGVVDGEVERDQRIRRPVEQPGRKAIVLHQEEPVEVVSRLHAREVGRALSLEGVHHPIDAVVHRGCRAAFDAISDRPTHRRFDRFTVTVEAGAERKPDGRLAAEPDLLPLCLEQRGADDLVVVQSVDAAAGQTMTPKPSIVPTRTGLIFVPPTSVLMARKSALSAKATHSTLPV